MEGLKEYTSPTPTYLLTDRCSNIGLPRRQDNRRVFFVFFYTREKGKETTQKGKEKERIRNRKREEREKKMTLETYKMEEMEKSAEGKQSADIV